MENKIYLFDTTLRDGQQTTGVNFTVSDKMIIANISPTKNTKGAIILLHKKFNPDWLSLCINKLLNITRIIVSIFV